MTGCPVPDLTGRRRLFYSAMFVLIAWPTAHTKPASSRARAVTTTVDFLPLALRAR